MTADPAVTAPVEIVPAARFPLERLAAIYNESRIDYIVPMPMNARRMDEYVRAYAVDLEASVVCLIDGEPAALGMLGWRERRGWITRLGVYPQLRGRRLGERLMTQLITTAQARGADRVQLEVIKGNEPAHRLFTRLGFCATRELLVVRRPPAALAPDLLVPPAFVRPFDGSDLLAVLRGRTDAPSWLDETESLVRLGKLEGLALQCGGESGWIVYHVTPFQLSHLVFHAPSPAVVRLLLAHLHSRHPALDTKLENLPALSPAWEVFHQLGYVESFRRIEMHLTLDRA